MWDLKRAFADFWNLHRRGRHGGPLLLETPSVLGAADPGAPQRARGCGCSRSGRCTSRRSTGPRRNIWLTQAYFIPDSDFVEALEAAAAPRRRRAASSLPQKSNHIVADWLSQGYYGEMLDAGVKIFRFQGAMVHAKTATIDGAWSTVGTANIDRLSMTGNYEVNVEFIDPAMAAADGADLPRPTCENCEQLTAEDWFAPAGAQEGRRAVPRPAAPPALTPADSLREVGRQRHPRPPSRPPQPGGVDEHLHPQPVPPVRLEQHRELRRRRRARPVSAQPMSLATW